MKVSKCCKASPVKVAGGEDDGNLGGTRFYICPSCEKPCDVIGLKGVTYTSDPDREALINGSYRIGLATGVFIGSVLSGVMVGVIVWIFT